MLAASEPIRVGLLTDTSCTDGKSREAAWKVLSGAPDIAPRRIVSQDIRDGILNELDVVIFPGGTGSGQASSLGPEGAANLQSAIRSGKGFIGICAGGYMMAQDSATKPTALISAQNHDGEHWARGEAFITVRNADDSTTHTMWYENGPIFVPAPASDLPAYTPLITYVSDLAAKDAPTGQMTGRHAVIAAPLGQGRVVAFGPHPELSPQLNHWLLNAIRWTARRTSHETITRHAVLEGDPR